MGKQGFDQRAALANALNTSGVVKAPPPAKKNPTPAPATASKGKGKGKKEVPEEAPAKTRQDLDEENRRFLENAERQRQDFYKAEAAKKKVEAKGADHSVTYVEDKDTRKPKAIADISDYWKVDLGILPFTPSDNIAAGLEDDDDADPQERLEFLVLFNAKLENLLRLRFHVFWSQVIYDGTLRKCLDSYLRYGLRAHDVCPDQGGAHIPAPPEEELQVTREVARRVLAVYARLSRPEESESEFISDGKFAQVVYEHGIFDIPKLIDLCAIYGDSNRSQVTKIVHSVFKRQNLYTDDFEFVVQHMLDGLRQCCAPLGGGGAAGLDVQDCVAFLPDILSCFIAIFSFFPEACVEMVVAAKSEADAPKAARRGRANSEDNAGANPIILVELMVALHQAVSALEKRGAAELPTSVGDRIVKLLSRLLGLVLGHRMAPRHGASAFDELLDWLRAHSDDTDMLMDLGRHGLEKPAMEWLASGLVDDAQLDFLEQMCGSVLPESERARGKRMGATCRQVGATGSIATGTSSGSGAPRRAAATAQASANDREKIKEIRDLVGGDYGEGFLLQCLLHYGGSVPAVVGAVFDESLPPQLKAMPKGLSLADAYGSVTATAQAPESMALSAEEKKRVLGQATRMDQGTDRVADASASAAGASNLARQRSGSYDDVYDDDVDDSQPIPMGVRVGAGTRGGSDSDSAADPAEEEDSGEEGQWQGGKGGKGFKGGKGKGKDGGPVQGQTFEARRKEENKARYGNHNRKEGAYRKMMKGT